MATGGPVYRSTKETENYERLCRAFVDLSTDVYRDILRYYMFVEPSELWNEVNACLDLKNKLPLDEQNKLTYSVHNCTISNLDLSFLYKLIRSISDQNLRLNLDKNIQASNIWTKVQSDRVLLSTLSRMQEDKVKRASRIGNYSECDCLLLSILLHSQCPGYQLPALVPTSNRWGVNPRPTDVKLGDDIERIRNLRNSRYGHVSDTCVPDPDFKAIWTELTEIMSRMDKELQTGGYYSIALDEWEKTNLDGRWEKYETKIKELNINVKLVQLELHKQKKDQEKTTHQVTTLSSEQKDLVEKHEGITQQVATLKQKQKATADLVKTQIASHDTNVAELSKGAKQMENRLEKQEDFTGQLQTGVKQIMSRLDKHEDSTGQLQKRVSSLNKSVAEMGGKVDVMQTQVTSLSIAQDERQRTENKTVLALKENIVKAKQYSEVAKQLLNEIKKASCATEAEKKEPELREMVDEWKTVIRKAVSLQEKLQGTCAKDDVLSSDLDLEYLHNAEERGHKHNIRGLIYEASTEIKLKREEPGPPLNVQCEPMDTYVTLTWSAPISPNGDVTYYLINVKSGPGSPRTVNSTTPVLKKEIATLTEAPTHTGIVHDDTDLKRDLEAALKEGSEKSRNIRIMLLGDVGVGKTSFGKHLLEETPENVQPTNGIDIFTEYMVIDLDTMKMEKIGKGKEKQVTARKIGKAVTSFQNNERRDLVKESAAKQIDNVVVEQPPRNGNKTLNECPQESSSKATTAFNPKDEDEIKKAALISRQDKGKKATAVFNPKDEDEIKKAALISRQDKGKKAYVSLWDFGGEKIFYASHHVFLSADAVYIVLYDLQLCFSGDERNIEAVLNWLDSIAAYCDGIPPVLLIGTHLDMLEGSIADKNSKAEQVTNKLIKRIYKIRQNWPYLVSFYISNRNANPNTLAEIWKSITEAAPKQSQWETLMPTKWLSLEHKLMGMRASGTNVLTFDNICEINRTFESPISDIDEIAQALRFLHYAGFVIFIGDKESTESLGKFVIINPQWVVRAFRCILTSSKHRGMIMQWTHFEETAKFSDQMIEIVWKAEEEFMKNKDFLIQTMEILGLITKPSDDNTTGNEHNQQKYYIVPSMLKDPVIKDIDKAMEEYKKSSAFVIDFKGNIVPRDIFDKLLTKVISKYPPHLSEDNSFRRGFGNFKIPKQNLGFMIHCERSAIKLTLARLVVTFNSYGEGFAIRRCITKWLQDIFYASGLSKLWEKHVESLHCKWNIESGQNYTPIAYFECEPQPCCVEVHSNGHLLDKGDLAPWIQISEVQQAASSVTFVNDNSSNLKYSTSATVPCGFINAQTAKFRKDNDDTQMVFLSDMKAKCSESVGLISSPEGQGTGFRVGKKYIMTCWHVVKPIVTKPPEFRVPMSDLDFKRLDHQDVFIEFDYKRNLSAGSKKQFKFSGNIPYYNEHLDVALLELKGDDIPPKVALGKHSLNDTITFIGHPEGKLMKEDPGIKVLEKTDIVKETIRNLNDCYLQQRGFIDEYLPLLDDNKTIFDCCFQFGASGSPGMIVHERYNEPFVVVMLQGGVPSSYLNLTPSKRLENPLEDKFLKEYGLAMDTLYDDMKKDPFLSYLRLDMFNK